MTEDIIIIAREAGEIALRAGTQIAFETKEGRANFVTEYDKKIQDFLVKKLSILLPEALFVCEENDFNQGYDKDKYRFIIDPIDGTTNFIRNAPEYAVCIGLMKGRRQICGVVHCPAMNITYFAQHGEGAYVHAGGISTRINVSESPLDGAVLAAGTAPYRADLLDKSSKLTRLLLERAADTRRTGSAAIDICRSAQGIYDLMFECMICPWDYAAASIILTEAGGKFCDFDGREIPPDAYTPYVGGSVKAVDGFVKYYRQLNL